jgi:predicted extracellular nuclease
VDVELARLPASPIVVGATSGEWTGVLGHDGRNPLLHVESLEVSPVTPPGPPARPGGSSIRIVNANLENFFNGNGDGSGFPGERGPRSHAAYQAKAARIEAAFQALQPDLLAVQELENDGFGPGSAAADLMAMLESATGAAWEAARPATERVGTDVIRVGIFFRPDRLIAEGPAQLLDSAPFSGLSRQPLTQLFSVVGSDARFWLSANHLKSKGSCPESGPDSSQKDGQGCWNQARVASVESLLPWLENLAEQSGISEWLVTGDMNAYRKEDPLDAFRAAGLHDLVLSHHGRESYSYVYRGERGTLDYALASPAMAGRVLDARNWNINSDWPRDDQLQPNWLRWSDHDPVVVDLDFSQ